MGQEFRNPSIDSKVYPTVITASEKDKVLKALIEGAKGGMKVTLKYASIPELYISKEQFEMLIKQFKRNRLLEDIGGYGDTYTLTADAHDKYRICAFQMQEAIMLSKIDKLIAEIERLTREDDPSAVTKLSKDLMKYLQPIQASMSTFIGVDNLMNILGLHE